MAQPGMTTKYTEDPNRPGEKRLPGFGWIPNRARHLFISCIGEFVGTFLFLFFAFAATQVANNLLDGRAMNIETLMYISLAFGFSLAVNVWIFFRISGGLFNPAVTFAMALIGAVDWVSAVLLVGSQICAGVAAAGIVSALFPGSFAVRTTLNDETSVVRGLFIEMFLTAQLVFCIFMLAAEKHRSTFIAPIGIGLALFVAELAGVYFTGGSLNPARSFGPDVVLARFDNYHWIYWIGPLLGAVLAVVFYRLIKALEYETANPGADGDGRHATHNDRNASEGYDAHAGPARGTGATDGTSEPMDFASRIRHPPVATRLAPPQSDNSGSVAMSDMLERSSLPVAEYRYGGDGHGSNRASGESYRSGPSAETGSSWSGSTSSSSFPSSVTSSSDSA